MLCGLRFSEFLNVLKVHYFKCSHYCSHIPNKAVKIMTLSTRKGFNLLPLCSFSTIELFSHQVIWRFMSPLKVIPGSWHWNRCLLIQRCRHYLSSRHMILHWLHVSCHSGDKSNEPRLKPSLFSALWILSRGTISLRSCASLSSQREPEPFKYEIFSNF